MQCIREKDHANTLTNKLYSFFKQNELCDVTLAIDGEIVRSHQNVLAASSEYFKRLFKENLHPHPVVYMKGVKISEMNAILDYMYKGETEVPQKLLTSLLITAEDLEIQGLTYNLLNMDKSVYKRKQPAEVNSNNEESSSLQKETNIEPDIIKESIPHEQVVRPSKVRRRTRQPEELNSSDETSVSQDQNLTNVAAEPIPSRNNVTETTTTTKKKKSLPKEVNSDNEPATILHSTLIQEKTNIEPETVWTLSPLKFSEPTEEPTASKEIKIENNVSEHITTSKKKRKHVNNFNDSNDSDSVQISNVPLEIIEITDDDNENCNSVIFSEVVNPFSLNRVAASSATISTPVKKDFKKFKKQKLKSSTKVRDWLETKITEKDNTDTDSDSEIESVVKRKR